MKFVIKREDGTYLKANNSGRWWVADVDDATVYVAGLYATRYGELFVHPPLPEGLAADFGLRVRPVAVRVSEEIK